MKETVNIKQTLMWKCKNMLKLIKKILNKLRFKCINGSIMFIIALITFFVVVNGIKKMIKIMLEIEGNQKLCLGKQNENENLKEIVLNEINIRFIIIEIMRLLN